ncbi:tetratricopeptide repeat protein [Blastomonas fulva]|uniref:tetratricopeptide repeat protein n=1 Tax=Blastomonas fulva TaxID=1550728 RepID=UPI000B203B78
MQTARLNGPGIVPVLAALKWWILAAVVIGALWATERFTADDATPEAIAWGESPFSGEGPPRTYRNAIERSDRAIIHARAAAQAAPDQWLMHEIHASEVLARAQLSGSYDDYAAARQALEAAFKVAVQGSGPHLMQASLDFSMHRLPQAQAQLAAIDGYAVPPESGDRAEIAAMRGDIAFYSGDYQAALALYDQADALVPGSASFRRAIFAARTGDVDQADAYLVEAERAYRSPTPQTRSYMELQRGILDLDRGRLNEAMSHFRKADALFPGRWLIEEHIAEVLNLQGKTAKSEALYRDIVRRTGHPEFIDALAGIAEARGDTAEAKRLYARSWAIWTKRLQQFPQATYGHAIDHCIARQDWACALTLAQRNHEARPYGEAKIALARALLGNGQVVQARTLIEQVLASRWRTPDLHAAAADIYQASGMAEKAAEQRRRARALNPLA